MTKEVKKRAVKVTPKVLMGNESKKYLDKIGFKMGWLDDLCRQVLCIPL